MDLGRDWDEEEDDFCQKCEDRRLSTEYEQETGLCVLCWRMRAPTETERDTIGRIMNVLKPFPEERQRLRQFLPSVD